MNILLAVDDSAPSLEAVEGCIAHARTLKRAPHIHLLHVHAPVPIAAATRHVSQDALLKYYREESEKQLAPARRLIDAAGLASTSHIHVGEAAEIIAQLAPALDCALICMGTRGQGALGRAVLGSVAAKVLRRARTPVLFARAGR